MKYLPLIMLYLLKLENNRGKNHKNKIDKKPEKYYSMLSLHYDKFKLYNLQTKGTIPRERNL